MTRRRPPFAVAAALAALLAAGGARAQTAAPAPAPPTTPPAAAAPSSPTETPFDETSWRRLVEGKTLYYETSTGYPRGFGLMGKEYYPPGGDRVVFVYANGDCYEGAWSYEQGVFCFLYDARHCFRHFDRDGTIVAQEISGREQVIVKMTDEVLACPSPDVS